MKKRQKDTLQAERKFYAAFMGDQPLCCYENSVEDSATIEDLDEAIADCNAMLQYSIDLNDKKEISYWRKLLQENKVQRRMLTA